MSIWAISDLHLSFSTPEKAMDIFGQNWEGYQQKIKEYWTQVVQPHDLVLLPGDLSWAIHFARALIDLSWVDALPGTKVIIKGNHDYWWPSNKKLTEGLPSSIHFINQNAFHWNQVAIGGARLWDTEEYQFNEYIETKENQKERVKEKEDPQEAKRIFEKELLRLEKSLQQMDPNAKVKIAMTHYPPIGADLKTSKTSKLLESFGINLAVFGHLHSIKQGALSFGEKNGVHYFLTSCDYLNFKPLSIYRR